MGRAGEGKRARQTTEKCHPRLALSTQVSVAEHSAAHSEKLPPPGKADCVALLVWQTRVPDSTATQSQLFRSGEGRGGEAASPNNRKKCHPRLAPSAQVSVAEHSAAHSEKLPPPGKADCVALLVWQTRVPDLTATQSQLFRSGEGRGGEAGSPNNRKKCHPRLAPSAQVSVAEHSAAHSKKLPPPGKADCVALLVWQTRVPDSTATQSQLFRSGEGRGGEAASPNNRKNATRG